MKSAFFGLMQYSSTLDFLVGRRLRGVPESWRCWRASPELLEKREVLNSSWKSRWMSISAPWGSTSTRPVLSSRKKGTCRLSSATFTHWLIPAALLPLPGRGVEVVARDAGDGCRHRVRTGGEAVDFYQAHGGAADLGSGCVQDQALALQEAETAIEQIHAGRQAPMTAIDDAIVAWSNEIVPA